MLTEMDEESASGVKCDFEMYGPMVRKGGPIAFHDMGEGLPENGGGHTAVLARNQIAAPPY
jgi:hypothetical protein